MSVFVPGHVTGFFNIEDYESKLKKGSCGVGFLLTKGVKTTIVESDSFEYEVNRGDDTIIREVLAILELDDMNFKVIQDIQLPIGAGFGTSAASALSLTLALNEFLGLGYSEDLCGQIAHMAEVNLGAGLGDVIAQTGNGLVLRTKPGAPGIGEIESYNHDVYVAYKTFGPIETSEIINDPDYKKIISEVGLKYLELFENEPNLDNFLIYSNKFSLETKLMSQEVKKQIDYFESIDDILGSSMAMLGNTVFALAYNEEVFKKLNIEGLHIDKLNNDGIVYD
ncbi:pantoate kinase [Methanobrevibacter sp.]|uniref:pantoate kinase n=1 Tax=Methanobrevibacter sp. TaxID=66852 RepID=UPI003D7EF90C